MPAPLRDLSVTVGGQGGDGSLTVVTLLARLLGRRSYHLYTARSVGSRIKGGPAAAHLRAAVEPVGCLADEVHLMVAFDADAVTAASGRLAGDAVVVYDSSSGPPPALPAGARLVEVPFGRLAVRDLRRDLFKNSMALGAAGAILGLTEDEITGQLADRFGGGPVLAGNRTAVRHGFEVAEDAGIRGWWGPEPLPAAERVLMSGNEAAALGFTVAGGRFFAGYPITPATDVLEWLEVRLATLGGVAVQAEDELAAVNMAIGASLAGSPAMVATSGPGIALMSEAISHAGAAEVPLVVLDCQRAGPSTGMPTKPEQSDVGMLAFGGNGDYPRIVLAPGGPEDAFHLTGLATRLAERLQGPVLVALDQAVAQDAATTAPFDLDAAPADGHRRLTAADLAGLTEYRRYLITEDGISPRAVVGTPGGVSLTTGNEHDEWGRVSTDPANRRRMIEKRARKVESLRSELPSGRRFGTPGARLGLLGVGMEAGVMAEAARMLSAGGLPVRGLQPRTLWPVPADTLAFVEENDVTCVVEHSHGAQLVALLSAAGAPRSRMRSITRYDGAPFRPVELAALVEEAVG